MALHPEKTLCDGSVWPGSGLALVLRAAILAATLVVSPASRALDGVSVAGANGNGTDVARLGAQWNWQKSWPAAGGWNITGFWDALIGHWHGRESIAQNRNIVELGGGPVFRLSPGSSSSVLPFLEYGIGVRLLSRTRINRDREFSTAFQFASHLGAGIRFGSDRRYDLMFRFQHISNGSIKKPNDGINLSEVRLAYHF